jgi:hypothetical protein
MSTSKTTCEFESHHRHQPTLVARAIGNNSAGLACWPGQTDTDVLIFLQNTAPHLAQFTP